MISWLRRTGVSKLSARGSSRTTSMSLRREWLCKCSRFSRGVLPDSRFSGFLDSQVSKGALAKGRSSSKALQPLCRQSAAIQTVGCIYPAWSFSPTRLNTADDPTRNAVIRRPSKFSVLPRDGVDLVQLHSTTLRRPYANWIRLLLLVTQLQTADSFGFGLVAPFASGEGSSCFDCPNFCWLYLDCPTWIWLCFECPVRSWIPSAIFAVPWTFPLASAAAPFLVGILKLGGFVLVASLTVFCLGRLSGKYRTIWLLAYLIADPHVACAMEPMSAAERKRSTFRAATTLVASRTVRPETRQGRQKLLEKFSVWLSLRNLLKKPADPEEICKWLVMYGQDMFSAGKSYAAYSETVNAVSAYRPLIKKQLAPAWDLAFAWLADEPPFVSAPSDAFYMHSVGLAFGSRDPSFDVEWHSPHWRDFASTEEGPDSA